MSGFYQILFVSITAGFFVFSNIISYQWAKTNQYWLWPLIFFSACVGYILFGFLVKQSNLSVSSGLVDALIVIISILIGIFVFKDVVTIKQTIGLVLACISVILIL